MRGGTLASEVVATDVGLDLWHAALARLRAGLPTRPHPLFGRLRGDEWVALHLRHAELHLSFFRSS